MKLESLKLLNFRNYCEMQVDFNPELNIIVGSNGHGKTNILEAIYFMSIGKSFRTNKDREVINFKSDRGYISIAFSRGSRNGSIEMLIGKKGKAIKMNGISIQKISELFGAFNSVIFSPEDIRMLKDGPAERRKFMDREISQISPLYYHDLYAYNKLLSQRNSCLKNRNVDEDLIDIYDIQICEYASRIYMARKRFVESLSEISKGIHSKIVGKPESFEIEYLSQLKMEEELDEHKISNGLKILLKKSRKDDIQRGNTRYGPHKDDIKIIVNSIDVRTYGSQGQQRTASISLKLSELELIKKETGEYPVLLLDDVLSELDEKRQKSLIDSLSGIQTFVTTAEEAHIKIFEGYNMSVYRVKEGIIT